MFGGLALLVGARAAERMVVRGRPLDGWLRVPVGDDRERRSTAVSRTRRPAARIG